MAINSDYLDDKQEEKQLKREKFNITKLIRNRGELPPNAIFARVISVVGKNTIVINIDNSNDRMSLLDNNIIECNIAGSLISANDNSNIIAVGDFVYYILNNSSSTNDNINGTIIQIEQRYNSISRKSIWNPGLEDVIACNFDYTCIFSSLKTPLFNNRFIDRLIAASELGGIKPIIFVNKIDLANKIDIDFIKYFHDLYNTIKIPFFEISVIRELDSNNIWLAPFAKSQCLLIGPSGAGKSSLLNKFFGHDIQSINKVSKKTSKGKHTTSSAKLFQSPLALSNDIIDKWNNQYAVWGYEIKNDSDGIIIDTPGIREFSIAGMDKDELALYFHEFDQYREKCKYYQCSHTHEPNCAVKDAVEKELISIERYESYFNLYVSIED